MSYEGRVQVICGTGHYSVLDTYDETKECHCGEKLVWFNYVDDTNGEAVNEIKMSDLAKFIKTPPEFCKCCGHQTSEPLYNVPTPEQVKAMRTITCGDGTEYITSVSTTSKGERCMITKEQLLKEVAEFTWDFGQCFFVETKHGNFVWSDPSYNGDNTMTEYSGTAWDFFRPMYGRSKGKHIISEYCGDQFTVTEEKK